MLSFKDSAAMEALYTFADWADDDDLAVAIRKRLDAIAGEHVKSNGAAEQINKQTARQDAKPLVCGKRWG